MSNEKAVKTSQLTNSIKQMSDYLKGKIDDNTTQLETTVSEYNNKMNSMKICAFLTMVNDSYNTSLKTDAQIRKNINDLKNAKVDGYGIVVEVMPSYEQCKQFENGEIQESQLIWSVYPNVETFNTYMEIAKENGLVLREIKFHNLWARNRGKGHGLNLANFITKYGNTIIEFLNGLTIKPIHATIINEWTSIQSETTNDNIIVLLNAIKSLGYKTGLTGTEVDSAIIPYVDNFYFHFYPFITNKKELATYQDGLDGFEKARLYEKHIEELKNRYPNKKIIIDEVGCSNYWESLARPEEYLGNKGYITTSDGMPMAIYANGAIEYFKNYPIDEIYIFWTDNILSELEKVLIKHGGLKYAK